MKLQTRVRQMLQRHFSFSKLAAFCVFNHFLHWLLSYNARSTGTNPSVTPRRRTSSGQGAWGLSVRSRLALFGDRWPQLCFWLEGSQVAEAVWMKSPTAFWRAHFQPAVSVWGLPARLPCCPAAGFLRCTSAVLARFLQLPSLWTEQVWCTQSKPVQ